MAAHGLILSTRIHSQIKGMDGYTILKNRMSKKIFLAFQLISSTTK